MKKIIFIIAFTSILLGCKQEQIPTYSGQEYIQLTTLKGYEKVFSFVYSGVGAVEDTLYIDMRIVGPTKPYDRQVKLKQVKEYGFEYEYDEDGIRTDSVLVEIGNQAIPGVHYRPFDTTEDVMVVKADSVYAKIGIVLLRDISLKEEDCRLSFEITDSKDLKIGDYRAYKGLVILQDRLSRPDGWNKDYHGQGGINPNASRWWDKYGPVKHQFMIDVTGERWDSDFFLELNKDEGKMYYYNAILTKALNAFNKTREEQGLPKLMEDPDDPNTVIKFV